MTSSYDFKVWLIAEQLKALEREGKVGFVQYAKLQKQYKELTGREWDGQAEATT